MKGLMLKELYVALKSCKMYFIIDAMFIAMSFALSGILNDSIAFLMFPVMISGEISISLLSFDEKSKWSKYSGTLPYSAAQMVSSKYLFSLAFVAITTLVTFLALIIHVNTIGGAELSEVGSVIGGMCVISLIVTSVGLPLCFRFGSERGRIIFFMTIFIAAFLLVNFIDKFYGLGQIRHIVWIIIAAVAALYALSWFISVAIYSRREITG
ncbi:MAG: ABC-2 transporter permease [Oscillospiraceae bacterium]|nr:ABC-2 transporter permease [Oscillospiraceae bacterium]